MLCYRIKWITVTLFLLALLIALTGCKHKDDQESAKETADDHETESLLFHDRVAMETPIRRLNIQSAYHEGYLYFFVLDESGYEIGKSEPPMEALVRLADAYGVSLDYLLCRTDEK